MNPAAGFLQALIMVAIIGGLIVGGAAYGIARLTEKKEIVVSKPIIPIKRLVTDGKTVDTVYVYPINQK